MEKLFILFVLLLYSASLMHAQQDTTRIEIEDIDIGGHQLDQKARTPKGDFIESDMFNQESKYPEPSKIKKEFAIDDDIYWGAGIGAVVGFGISELIIYSDSGNGVYSGHYTNKEAFGALIGTLAGAGLGILIAYQE